MSTPQKIQTCFYSNNQGEGFTSDELMIYGEDRGEFKVGAEMISIGTKTTLNGFFDFPHEFIVFIDGKGMGFHCGCETDLFGMTHYYKVIHLLSPTRLFVMYTRKSGRDWNFINGAWK